MLKVRLQRVGRRNDPSFRVVVTESTRGPKSGKYIEMLGSYNPRQKTVALKGDRIKYWLSVGAQVTGTVHNLLIKEKITTGKKINVLPKKSPIKKEVVSEAATEKADVKDSQKIESEVKVEQVEEQKGEEPSEDKSGDSSTSEVEEQVEAGKTESGSEEGKKVEASETGSDLESEKETSKGSAQ